MMTQKQARWWRVLAVTLVAGGAFAVGLLATPATAMAQGVDDLPDGDADLPEGDEDEPAPEPEPRARETPKPRAQPKATPKPRSTELDDLPPPPDERTATPSRVVNEPEPDGDSPTRVLEEFMEEEPAAKPEQAPRAEEPRASRVQPADDDEPVDAFEASRARQVTARDDDPPPRRRSSSRGAVGAAERSGGLPGNPVLYAVAAGAGLAGVSVVLVVGVAAVAVVGTILFVALNPSLQQTLLALTPLGPKTGTIRVKVN